MMTESFFYLATPEGLVGPIAGDNMVHGYNDKSILPKALKWAKLLSYKEVHERVPNKRMTIRHRV